MSCCSIITQVFTSEAITTVPYTGDKPTVSVIYLQPDGTFLSMGISTLIDIQAADVVVDHGGSASGIVKLLQ